MVAGLSEDQFQDCNVLDSQNNLPNFFLDLEIMIAIKNIGIANIIKKIIQKTHGDTSIVFVLSPSIFSFHIASYSGVILI
jgi:hypothetical protein